MVKIQDDGTITSDASSVDWSRLKTYVVPIEEELKNLAQEIEEKAWEGCCVRQLEARHKAMLNLWLSGEEYHVKF